MTTTIRKWSTFTLIAFFSTLLIAGCQQGVREAMQDIFAPGLREATEELTADVEAVATDQGGLATLINEGREVLESQIEAAKASIETINFRSEEDKEGAVAMLASLEAKVNKVGDAATAAVSGFDAKVNKLIVDAQGVAADFAAADSTGAALSVFGELLLPILGPYAPLADVALGILGIGGTARVVGRRAKTKGATSVLAPIEKARNKALEAKLNADDPSRKFIVFDAGLTQPVFDANGAGAIIDSFRGLADTKAA